MMGSVAQASTEDAAGPPDKVPLLLRVVAFSVFFFPSSLVVATIGAAGTVAILLSCVLFAAWFASVLWGLHNPFDVRHPGRIGLGALLLVSAVSYSALYAGWSAGSTVTGRAAADRWLILLVAVTAVALVTAETVRSCQAALSLARPLICGATFCGLVAAVQFWTHQNPVDWMQLVMPGFSDNGGDTTFQVRGALVRVAGTTFTPIELAVVSAMMLPLSVWRAVYDVEGRKSVHWAQSVILTFAIAATVSRSGTLALAVVVLVFVPFLPGGARRWAAVAVPAVVVAMFLLVPGFITTITGALTASETDPSISTRINNYPRVQALLVRHPWFGLGPGNYEPRSALEILDNEYLRTAVTLGVLGLVAMTLYLWLPALTAFRAARLARAPGLRTLAAASAAACGVAAVTSLTFDSMAFPVFALLYPFFIGLSGAVWNLVRRERADGSTGVSTQEWNDGSASARHLPRGIH